MDEIKLLYKEAVDLLKQLITIPSFSKEEDQTADCIAQFFNKKQIPYNRVGNNIWASNLYFDINKPTILLNSHHDTVKPNSGYQLNPFDPLIKDGKLFGLGSNDAGGCLVSLLACFVYYYNKPALAFNLIIAATAEEEISGKNGVEALIPQLPTIDFAIVGEPTLLNLAIAERGLMVIDAKATGTAGHAARNEGENALYKAVKDIEWIRQYQFEKVSELLGPVKMTVTSFNTENKQHNLVPASAEYLIDIRVNELYLFEEILETLKANLTADISPRSTRIKSTLINPNHPIVKAGEALGSIYYGSPTTSDKALMPFPALKVGPGDSARSHNADEFIYLLEIEKGIEFYINLLKGVL
ncbi:MAG TPA: M20 family metallo-hydrolase [Sediminibacterium sp.]|uniref:M20 family metallo-hydrolase n=1 Tax=Sediminibacterium sp. TaxID=1917865 RepID=UPI0008AE121E|nr:M20 family metallo-hydrolase [Sediminibacterium sp.]OHC86682.1 MAG: acetylornithine deacetylase [Sphingobacteriia bacterium RIFOXYC2_FULL_35_18]OHC88460.1 MAG: acetylornithine deacetylase [Sphingobacteriia bacterium RIFOXYD2_FULL_35_12]HLD51962.1 M20 family metallo-hydrolase [Sediminibacterium sp.]